MIGIGIIGAGFFGGAHARALSGLDRAHVVAACRSDAAAIAEFTGKHGGTPYTDWRALLDDTAVDAVVIATPHDLHRDIAVAALDAGKHVLLEKPMAVSIADCDAIAASAHESSGRFMVGHLPRFFLPMRAAADFLSSGDIGRPVTGTSALIKLWMEPNRQPWHLDRATGGGMLMTAGIHALDRLIHLMGGTAVSSVSAMMSAAFHDQDADDTAFINLRFADGRLSQVASIGYADGAGTTALEVICEGGTLRLDANGRMEVGRGGVWRDLPCPDEADPMDGALRRQWEAFIDAIETGGPSPIGADYGRHLVAIIAAARQSNEERREITVEPNIP